MPVQQQSPSQVHHPGQEDRSIRGEKELVRSNVKQSARSPACPPTFPLGQTYQVKNNLDHQRATRAHGNFFPITQIIDGDLEAVSAWAGKVVDLHGGVEGHVFDFDLIVDGEGVVGHFGRLKADCLVLSYLI